MQSKNQQVSDLPALQAAELVTSQVDNGESWADIGRRLGVSKQAAWERFGKPFPAHGGLAPGPEREG